MKEGRTVHFARHEWTSVISRSQVTAAKIMDNTARVPGCGRQAADAVSAYTQVKVEDAPTSFRKFQSHNVQIFGYVYPNTSGQKSWSSMEDPVVPLERNLCSHLLAGLLWEQQFGKVLLGTHLGKVPNWDCLFVNRAKDFACPCMWTMQKWL